jgi:hypothetical protein
MAVDEPSDVLAELRILAQNYTGDKPWIVTLGSRASNPVKLMPYKVELATTHPDVRNVLSAREGAALLYAFQCQNMALNQAVAFSRFFSHRDGRSLVLENGVVRDLLGLGVIGCTDVSQHSFVITGLGLREMASCFPGHVN